MKNLVKLLDEIRKLDGIDMMKIEAGELDGYQVISELESVFEDFYLSGYNTGVGFNNIDPESEFQRALTYYYKFGKL